MVKYVYFDKDTSFEGKIYEAGVRYLVSNKLYTAIISGSLTGANFRNTKDVPVVPKPGKKERKNPVLTEVTESRETGEF